MDFAVFHSCQYGSARMKRTMLAFNHHAFRAICKTCPGTSRSHRHAKWGFDKLNNRFATASETAYPMKLARVIATQFIVALQQLGIKTAPEVLSEITCEDAQFLPVIRAQAGLQPKASKLPPLIPTFAQKFSLSGFSTYCLLWMFCRSWPMP